MENDKVNAVLLYYTGSFRRLIDFIMYFFMDKGIIKPYVEPFGWFPMTLKETGEEVGGYVPVEGPIILIKICEFISNHSFNIYTA